MWYALSGPTTPKLLSPAAFFERYICYECPEGFVADKVFYTISGVDLPVWLKAFLNSSVVALFVEVEGYQLNHGGIFITTNWLENLPILALPESETTFILEKAYHTLRKREISLYANEIHYDDRIILDTAILKALGLPEELREEIHATVAQLMQNRIIKARRNVTQKGRD